MRRIASKTMAWSSTKSTTTSSGGAPKGTAKVLAQSGRIAVRLRRIGQIARLFQRGARPSSESEGNEHDEFRKSQALDQAVSTGGDLPGWLSGLRRRVPAHARDGEGEWAGLPADHPGQRRDRRCLAAA